MNKISNIYVGNAPLMPSTGGGSGLLNINDYLTNPVQLLDVQNWNSSMFSNKLVFADFIYGTYRYTGYLCGYYRDSESSTLGATIDEYNVFYSPSISFDSKSTSINIKMCVPAICYSMDSDWNEHYEYAYFKTLFTLSKESLTNNSKVKIFIGDAPALLSL